MLIRDIDILWVENCKREFSIAYYNFSVTKSEFELFSWNLEVYVLDSACFVIFLNCLSYAWKVKEVNENDLFKLVLSMCLLYRSTSLAYLIARYQINLMSNVNINWIFLTAEEKISLMNDKKLAELRSQFKPDFTAAFANLFKCSLELLLKFPIPLSLIILFWFLTKNVAVE